MQVFANGSQRCCLQQEFFELNVIRALSVSLSLLLFCSIFLYRFGRFGSSSTNCVIVRASSVPTSLRFQTLRTCRWLFTISASHRSAQLGSVLQDFYQVHFLLFFLSFLCACYWLFTPPFFFLSPCSRYGHNTYIRGMVVCLVVTHKHLHGALCCETFKVVYGKCICVKRFISLSFDVVFSLFIGIFLSHNRTLYVRRLHFQIRWYVTFLSWLAIDSVRAVCRCWRS